MSEKANNSKKTTPSPEASKEKIETTGKKKKRDPVKNWTAATLTLCVVIFGWYLVSDKYTPYTSNGRVKAFIVPIAPEVAGVLSKVSAVNNQIVSAEQELALIDPAEYELAVRGAEAELQQASQTSSADVNAVSTAQAKVAEAEANLSNAEIKGQRIITLSKKGAASLSRADDARSNIEASRARLAAATSELERAKNNLGTKGKDNSKVQAAFAALETAKLDLYRTSIRAPADGIITNLTVNVGHFASTGAPIMTFISTSDVWVQADMRENSLGHIKKGNPVDIVLDSAPGKVFKGEVLSVAYGVSDDSTNTLGGLPAVQTSTGWLRQAQHFPVLIGFSDDSAKGFRRAGGQVNIIIYTGSHPILNTAGRTWIRLVSFLSHIY